MPPVSRFTPDYMAEKAKELQRLATMSASPGLEVAARRASERAAAMRRGATLKELADAGDTLARRLTGQVP